MAISTDDAGTSATFAPTKAIRFPLLADTDLKVASLYGVAMKGRDVAVPSVIVIRPDGAIAYRYVGEDMSDRPPRAAILGELKKLSGR